MATQSPEWFEQRSPKCKTQDVQIREAEKTYEKEKLFYMVEKKQTKSSFIHEQIKKDNNDIYDRKNLPGAMNGFALYKQYCRLWDKEAHSKHWCEKYLEFLLEHPERFWYALYAYAKGSSKTEKRSGNTKPYTGGELVTVINALGVDEYFGREMLYVDGDEFYPEPKYVTYFVRYVNAYAGSWQGKPGFESITERPNDILLNFGITLNSRPRPLNFAECPECGCRFNVQTKSVQTPGARAEKGGKLSIVEMYNVVETAQKAKEAEIKERKETNKYKNIQAKIKRATSAAAAFGLSLSLDLSVSDVVAAADVLIAAAEIQKKPKVAAGLKVDKEALLWYLEEFRPS